MKHTQDSSGRVRFIEPSNIRDTGQSELLANSSFYGVNGQQFTSLMLVNTTGINQNIGSTIINKLDSTKAYYNETLQTAYEIDSLGGKGSPYGSSGSDIHFQFLASDEEIELKREKFPNEVILTVEQVIELEFKATENGYYYVVVITEREDGSKGFVFTMSDLTQMGCDQSILSALDYNNFTPKQKACFLALWNNKPGPIELATRSNIFINKKAALEAVISECRDQKVRTILESDLVQQAYNSISQDFRAVKPDEAEELMRSCRVNSVATSMIHSTQGLRQHTLI